MHEKMYLNNKINKSTWKEILTDATKRKMIIVPTNEYDFFNVSLFRS